MTKSIILSGPSGVGKTTIISDFLRRNRGYVEPASYHTRPQRDDDRDNYKSISPEEFSRRYEDGDFFCVSEFLGWKYAWSLSDIENIRKMGQRIISDFSIDNLGGITSLKNSFDAIFVYLLPPNEEVLRERLETRPQSDLPERRLRRAIGELHSRQANKNWSHIDIEIVNLNLRDTIINLEQLALR